MSSKSKTKSSKRTAAPKTIPAKPAPRKRKPVDQPPITTVASVPIAEVEAKSQSLNSISESDSSINDNQTPETIYSEVDENELKQPIVSHSIERIDEKSEVICNFSYKDLQADGHKLTDDCPICRWKVSKHILPEKDSSVLSARIIKDALQILEKQNCSWPIRSHSSLAESSCKMFFQKIEMFLRNAVSDKKYLVQLLPLIITDQRGKLWTDANIVNVEPALSWEEAKKKFSKHFDSRSLNEDLRAEFNSVIQRPNETVQQFAERFTYYVGELDLKDENTVIYEFKSKLRSDIQIELARSINSSSGGEAQFYREYNKLDLFIQKCIEVSRVLLAINLSGRRDQDREVQSSRRPRSRISRKRFASSTPPETSKKPRTDLNCEIHGLGNHSSEDCRTLLRQAHKKSRDNSDPKREANSKTSQPPDNYLCHNCNTPGHFIQNCPQPRKNAREPSVKFSEPEKSTSLPTGSSKPKAGALARRSSPVTSRSRTRDESPESDSTIKSEDRSGGNTTE